MSITNCIELGIIISILKLWVDISEPSHIFKISIYNHDSCRPVKTPSNTNMHWNEIFRTGFVDCVTEAFVQRCASQLQRGSLHKSHCTREGNQIPTSMEMQWKFSGHSISRTGEERSAPREIFITIQHFGKKCFIVCWKAESFVYCFDIIFCCHFV